MLKERVFTGFCSLTISRYCIILMKHIHYKIYNIEREKSNL